MMVLVRAHAVVVGAELDQLRRRHRAGDGPLSCSILSESRIVPIDGCLNNVVRGCRSGEPVGDGCLAVVPQPNETLMVGPRIEPVVHSTI
jgi:hypothetical protein